MEMVGTLAYQADDDQEDSDFFEQLANDLGNGHLQQSHEQEEEASFSEVFSKLSVGGEGSALARPVSAIDDGDDSAGDDFWLEENLIGEPPLTSNGGPSSAVLQMESLQTDTVTALATPSTSAGFQMDAIPASDVGHQAENSDENVAFVAVESSHQAENSAEVSALSVPGLKTETFSTPGNSSLEENSANWPQAENTFEMERASGAAVPEDLCPAASGVKILSGTGVSSSCISSQDIPELDLTDLQEKEGTQQPAMWNSHVENALVSLDTGDCIPNAQAINNSNVESDGSQAVDTQPAPIDDHANGTEAQPSTSVRELQWSNLGDAFTQNTFGSYSDFLDLDGQAGASSNYGTGAQSDSNQVESLMWASLATSHPQEGWSMEGESLVNQAPPASFGFYGTGVDQWNETGFWNQQGVLNYGIDEQVNGGHANVTAEICEKQVVESKELGPADVISEPGGQFYGDFSMSGGNYEEQPQGDLQQSWENMYPGWYFDYGSKEWKQTEGWDSGIGSLAVEEQVPVSSMGHLSSGTEEVDLSCTLTPQLGQFVSTVSGSTWQTGQEQVSWSALGSIKGLRTDSHVGNNRYTADNDSGYQQHVNWEEQYPGWYYDYQAQEWRQIAGDSQSWSSNQDNMVEASQVANGLNSSPLPEGGWTEKQGQPHHQNEVNQNIFWHEGSQSLYRSGGGVTTLTRGMSFNSWAAEPAAMVLDAGPRAGADTDNMEEALQSGNARSWIGFQGDGNNISSFNYQSQTDYNLADKAAFFGNPQGFFQPHNAPGAAFEGARSSAGRPLHALVVFGFGGKLVTMKARQMGTPEPIVLHDLNQLVLTAENCSGNEGISYFSALNRQGLASPLVGHGVTSKELLKWVDKRIENCESEDPYCTSSEALRILWGVLKIACLHYGKLRSLTGSMGLKSQVEDGPEVALGRLLASANSQSHWNQNIVATSDALHSLPTEHQLQATAAEVRRNLIDGKRKEALQLAQQGHLWGLALVLAWQLGEKVYADTVLQMAQQQFLPGSPLRTLLFLFAGQTTELFKTQSLSLSAGTPVPYLPVSSSAKDSAGGMLGDWLGNLSIIAANPTKGDDQVITHLGDTLWKDRGEVAGAHTCYLVAEVSFECFSKEARLCLVGADHFKYQRTFATPQAIQRTELYEYAKVLGNPQYILVPFQPYKLLYAHMLAEAGKITEACRYCQAVTKGLKNAGRAPEIEFCKQSALALEERLRLHSQGGYSLNFSTGKLVGKVMGTIDSTIHKIIGGPPVSEPSPAFSNLYTNDQRYGNTATSAKATPLVPSASISNLANVNRQVDVPTRSVSQPNLSRSPTQEVQNSAAGSEIVSAPPKQHKAESSSGGYLARFGSQFFAKAVGFMKPNKEAKLGDENKFYYDEKLKRWVEVGVEQSLDEVTLPPPPIAASFSSNFGTPPSTDGKIGVESQGQGLNAASLSLSSDLPPKPPSVNQFSAHGRLHGVRSRYVDTFNKGNTASPAKSLQSPIVPTGGWGKTSTPSQFFAAASVSLATDGISQMFTNGHLNDGNPEFPQLITSNSTVSGHLQTEHDPLLPKNLSSSFMAVPLIQRHSSESNVTMLTNNVSATGEDMNGLHGTSASGNIARAGSWSGESLNASTYKSASSASGTHVPHRLPNGSRADTQVEAFMNSAAAVSSNSLPLPPVIKPPTSYTGFESSHVPAVGAGNMLSGSLQGGIYGEMQEVEL